MRAEAIRAFHSLYDVPLAEAFRVSNEALQEYRDNHGLLLASAYDKAAEAYQMALYRRECARKVMS